MNPGTFLVGALLAMAGFGLAGAISDHQISPGLVPLTLISLIGGTLLCIASAAAITAAWVRDSFVTWMRSAPR